MNQSLLEEISWEDAQVLFPAAYKPFVAEADYSILGVDDKGRLVIQFGSDSLTRFLWNGVKWELETYYEPIAV